LKAALLRVRIGEAPRDGARRLRGEAVCLAGLGVDPSKLAEAEALAGELERWVKRYCPPLKPKRGRRR
jgi:hypothetical protein